jgi:hypothetical protein
MTGLLRLRDRRGRRLVAPYAEAMLVTLWYVEDCPNWRETASHLERLAPEFVDLAVVHRVVATPEEALAQGFRGSPSVTIDGVEAFGDAPVGFFCRRYETPDGPAGSPTLEQLRTRLGRA